MRVLLTGASGFLGRAWSMAADPRNEIFAVGRMVPAELRDRVNLVQVDLAEPGALAEAIASRSLPASIDAVAHLAVSRNHRHFPDRALDMFEINAAVTAQLLDYAVCSGAQHFLLGSTGSVYGSGAVGRLEEQQVVAPEAFFAATKRAAELLAGCYRPHFPIGILRFFFPYGSGQSDRLVPDLISRVQRGDPVILPPDGDGMAFTAMYVDDAVQVIDRCLAERWDEIVNVSTDEPLSIRSAACAIGEVLSRSPIFETSSAASTANLVPDLTKLKRRLPATRFALFREGVRQMVSQ